ncbi:RICIN domain-containing protein [Streptomyces melanogenes]|uniref:RICIN domain-containing protein n=1 Tax=Streptomyces melanogenes TaxID=67326 RepID=UPI00167CF2E2|nr:hypothetical protein [Streptomyces melanogenes]
MTLPRTLGATALAAAAGLALFAQATSPATAAEASVSVRQHQSVQSWAESGQFHQDQRPATVVTVPGGQDTNGQNVTASLWYGNPDQSFTVYERAGQVVFSHNGYVLDQDVPTGRIQLWQASGGEQALNTFQIPDNQRWQVVSKDAAGWSMLQNVATGKCLKSNGRDHTLTTAACDGNNDAAQWWNQF